MTKLNSAKILFCLISIGFSAAYAEEIQTTLLDEIRVSKPAFLSLQQIEGSDTTKNDLVITSFRLSGKDSVYWIKDIDRHLRLNSTPIPRELVAGTVWPNQFSPVPPEIFGENFFTISGGFLVPGKRNGQISLWNSSTNAIYNFSADRGKWFYHQTGWCDLDGDGNLDLLTARARVSLPVGDTKGQLLGYMNPGHKGLHWKMKIIGNGPDVHFVCKDLNLDGHPEIIATEFFSKKLSIHWYFQDKWHKSSIDDNLGSAFDLELTDLNLDGQLELLVTNHEPDEKASVFAYEIPKHLPTPMAKQLHWKRHTLLTGIETRQPGTNQGSPGSAQTFKPTTEHSKKPYILVSGDGSQRVHLLVPQSQDPDNWNYREHVILDTNSTVGKIATGDVDQDGVNEVFVPAYDKNRIYVLNILPSNARISRDQPNALDSQK